MKNPFFLILCMLFSFNVVAQKDTITPQQIVEKAKRDKTIGLDINPIKIQWTLNRNEITKEIIKITNKFPEDITMRAKFLDVTRDSFGVQNFAPAGTLPHTLHKMIGIRSMDFTIKAGTTFELPVAMRLPDSDTADDHMRYCMIMFETFKENVNVPQDDSVRAKIEANFRVGVLVTQTPPALAAQKGMEMLSFSKLPGDSVYQIICKNTGESELRAKSYVEFTSLQTGEKTTVDSKELGVFPGDARIVNFKVPENLKKGKYRILGVVEPLDDAIALQASEAEVTIK